MASRRPSCTASWRWAASSRIRLLLPVPSNGHWMPLTSIVAAASMAVLGPTYGTGTIPLIILSALIVPLTYLVSWELWGSRWVAIVAAVLAIFAGPLLIMYPSADNFAVFGATGAASLYCSMRAVKAAAARTLLVAAGAFAGLATLARVDGVLLTVAVATAWFVRRGWSPWRNVASGGASLAWGLASAAAFLLVLAPWLVRQLHRLRLAAALGRRPYALDQVLQRAVLHRPRGESRHLPRLGVAEHRPVQAHLVGRARRPHGRAAGRHLPHLLPRRALDLPTTLGAGSLLRVLRGHVLRDGRALHLPCAKGRLLPLGTGMAAVGRGDLCGRGRASSRPPSAGSGRSSEGLPTQRFVAVAGLGGAAVLSLIGSTILFQQWDRSRVRDEQLAAFLRANAEPEDVFMASDPASIYPLTGNQGVAAPFDPFRVIEQVVDAYDVRWVVVLSAGGGEPDPLNMWDGASGTDSEGAASVVPARGARL